LAALQEKNNGVAKVMILKSMNKMSLDCKSCGNSFDSTFTVEEYESLPTEQYEAGTLHICPHCGFLGTYLLKDYKEYRKGKSE
jgi:hypothetical protein